MPHRKEKYRILDDIPPLIGTWLVYIAYLIFIASSLLGVWIQRIDNDISSFFLCGGCIIFILLIFLIAPVLQIMGIYNLWIKKSVLPKRKKMWSKIIACGGYLLNALAFIWLYKVFLSS